MKMEVTRQVGVILVQISSFCMGFVRGLVFGGLPNILTSEAFNLGITVS